MRANIEEYNAVVAAAEKYIRELFTEDAVIFGYLNGKLQRGPINQLYEVLDTVPGGPEFKARTHVLLLEETLAVVRVVEDKFAGRIDFTDVLVLLKIEGEWKCVSKAYNQNSNTIQKEK